MSVPTKPSEPKSKANTNVSIESIISQYDQLNTVKVTKVEQKKVEEEEIEDVNIKSILSRYGDDGLVVAKAKVKEEVKSQVADIEAVLTEVAEEDAKVGEYLEEEEKAGNFDFTSLTGLSDDEEEEEEEDEEKAKPLVKEEMMKKEMVKEEIVRIKPEETLAEMAEQVEFKRYDISFQ